MSGCIWKFSDQIDDVDVEMLTTGQPPETAIMFQQKNIGKPRFYWLPD